jgi:hypothetical protein
MADVTRRFPAAGASLNRLFYGFIGIYPDVGPWCGNHSSFHEFRIGAWASYKADEEMRPARTADRHKKIRDGITKCLGTSTPSWHSGRRENRENTAVRRPGCRHKQLSPYPFQRAGEKKSSRFTKLLASATWFRSNGTLILAAKREGLGRFRRQASEARARELGA